MITRLSGGAVPCVAVTVTLPSASGKETERLPAGGGGGGALAVVNWLVKGAAIPCP